MHLRYIASETQHSFANANGLRNRGGLAAEKGIVAAHNEHFEVAAG